MPAAIDEGTATRPLGKHGPVTPRSHLLIGLVNNMPASSRPATERQFRNLIASASAGIPTKLVTYTSLRLTGARARSGTGGEPFDLRDLWQQRLDGLIVTGSEPAAEHLTGEPNWSELAELVDWAEDNTHSTIWSCLAAHAAVYRLDGIPRRRLPNKLFGLFECTRAEREGSTSELATGLPDRFCVPHSRWNGIAANTREMTTLDYRALTQSSSTGMDIFVKKRRSLFVLCQGHPEYEPDSLLLEYRRDVARFLRRERESYPDTPCQYFDEEAGVHLAAFRNRALLHPDESLLRDFPVVQFPQGMKKSWHAAAIRLYRNWLLYLAERKAASDAKFVPGFVA